MPGSPLDALKPLTPAEERILADLKVGEFDRLGDGLRPETDDPARLVRAAFLRALARRARPAAVDAEGVAPRPRGLRPFAPGEYGG